MKKFLSGSTRHSACTGNPNVKMHYHILSSAILATNAELVRLLPCNCISDHHTSMSAQALMLSDMHGRSGRGAYLHNDIDVIVGAHVVQSHQARHVLAAIQCSHPSGV